MATSTSASVMRPRPVSEARVVVPEAALKARLVACVNLLPKIESHYWWQGKLERGSEVLMILKTTRRALRKLETLVLRLHPYDTAEIVVLPVSRGSERYLAWWRDSCRA